MADDRDLNDNEALGASVPLKRDALELVKELESQLALLRLDDDPEIGLVILQLEQLIAAIARDLNDDS